MRITVDGRGQWCRRATSDGAFMVEYQNLRTVKQLAAEAAFITEGKLRWWIFHAHENGFDTVIVKIEGRVYLDLIAFNLWLESKRLAPADAA